MNFLNNLVIKLIENLVMYQIQARVFLCVTYNLTPLIFHVRDWGGWVGGWDVELLVHVIGIFLIFRWNRMIPREIPSHNDDQLLAMWGVRLTGCAVQPFR